jgi:hypothetical protein
LQLTELAAQDKKVALAATVKETGVNDHALLEFYEQYFHSYPIYMDEKWRLYTAMGGRRFGVLTMLKGIFGARKRYQQKNIAFGKTNFNVEGWMAGGVLVFNKQGELIYVQEEHVGLPCDVEALKAAIEEARRSNVAQNQRSSTTSSKTEDNSEALSSQGHEDAMSYKEEK